MCVCGFVCVCVCGWVGCVCVCVGGLCVCVCVCVHYTMTNHIVIQCACVPLFPDVRHRPGEQC